MQERDWWAQSAAQKAKSADMPHTGRSSDRFDEYAAAKPTKKRT